jgi:signal transduction histidine kinase
MSDMTSRLVAAGAYAVTALVWAIIAQDLWQFRLCRRPQSELSRLLPLLSTCITASFAIAGLCFLVNDDVHGRQPLPLIAVRVISDAFVVLAVAMFRHAALLFPLREQKPTRRWVAINYGIAGLLILVDAYPFVLPGETFEAKLALLRTLFFVYVLVTLILTSAQIARFARRGVWRPGTLGEARSAAIFILVVGIIGVGTEFALRLHETQTAGARWGNLLNAAVGIVLAAPFAARVVGTVVRRLALIAATVAIALLTHLGVRAVSELLDGAVLAQAMRLLEILLPVLAAVAAQAPLRAAADQLLFRRSRRRRAELHEFLQHLSPDLGVSECVRRALHEVVQVMNLRGAAMVFDDADREPVVAGEVDIAPLAAAWPRRAAADALPSYTFAAGVFRELPAALQQPLIEAEIVSVVPVISQRRRWGYAFVTSGAFGAAFTEEDIVAVQSLSDQCALLFDAAELLERAVAVERSLAHSEKLAAIGELAARVAHEIRNPVTAARSLAQQLAREPGSRFRAEHELILKELERIERQVAALLRFARREELRLERVDIGEFASTVVREMRQRLDAAGIDVRLDLGSSVTAAADREKLRQVAINLIENAMDALAARDGERRLSIASAADNGSGTLEIADNGPGVPDEALPRLFEPFFSLKATGTGLGLAIAKRTVEAHGGRLTASRGAAGGMRFKIELPVADRTISGGHGG